MNMGIWSDMILGVVGILFIWFFGYVVLYFKETRDINEFFDDFKGEKGDR